MQALKLGIDLSHALAETPRVGVWWRDLEDDLRRVLVNRSLEDQTLQCVVAKPSGVVILEFRIDFSPADRGALLRAIETRLKRELDPAIEVYLQAQPDKNALRKLRGVQIGELA